MLKSKSTLFVVKGLTPSVSKSGVLSSSYPLILERHVPSADALYVYISIYDTPIFPETTTSGQRNPTVLELPPEKPT